MNEAKLLDELTAALDEAASTVRAPDGMAGYARRRARGRRLARGLAAGGPAAGLAAGLVLAVGSQHVPAHPVPSAHAKAGARQPEVLTVAYVTGRARTALRNMSDLIVETTGKGWVGWSDPATNAARLEQTGRRGQLAADEGWTYSGHKVHRIFVDYQRRTWWEVTSRAPVAASKPGPSGLLPAPGNSASGQVRLLGHPKLAGRDTILVKYGPPRGFRPSASEQWPTELVWLDAVSYLPVRIRISGAGPVEEQELAYFRATDANLARLVVTPPAGFKRVPAPPFRGDGRPGLGLVP